MITILVYICKKIYEFSISCDYKNSPHTYDEQCWLLYNVITFRCVIGKEKSECNILVFKINILSHSLMLSTHLGFFICLG